MSEQSKTAGGETAGGEASAPVTDAALRASVRALAHDFNNLISAILGHASYLRMIVDPGSDAEETAAVIEASAERAKALTAKLYDLSRGGESVVSAPVDLHAVIREVAATLGPAVNGATRVDLQLEAKAAAIRGDATQLSRLLMNLAVNAREAVGDDGGVAIRTRDGADGLHVEVADDGPGVRAEDRALLFEPTYTTKANGHGLGLAIVAQIARLHGAKVDVADNQPRGAVFRVVFPRV